MKTRILSLFMFVAVISFAQTNDSLKTNKQTFVQEKGTMSFGIDAINTINFIGNMFSQSGTNSFSLNLPNNGQSFLFRYVQNENLYFRAMVRVGYSSITNKENIMDDTQSDPNVNVEDSYKNTGSNVGLMVGVEKRKGHRRLQGFYGAEIGFNIQTQSETYKYGNSLSNSGNIISNTTDFGRNIDYNTNPDGYVMRKLEQKNGTGFGIDFGAFFGAEFFITKQFSVAGEFTWYLIYNNVGNGSKKYEYWNSANDVLETYEQSTLGGNALLFDNTPTGTLIFSLYF